MVWTYMTKWGKSIRVDVPARSTGNIWCGSSLTVPVPMPTSFSGKPPRGLSEGSGSLSWTLLRNLVNLSLETSVDERDCVREFLSPLDVNDNQMPHVHVRMEGLRRRCKHCYARGVRKEVVKGCAVCNIHMCSQCFLEKHWTHLTFPWCKTALWF